MKKRDKIAYMRSNRHKTVREIADALGISTRAVCAYAKEIGIVLSGQRVYNPRTFCDPPYSCPDCPYPDCINSGPATQGETDYVENALGKRNMKKAVCQC